MHDAEFLEALRVSALDVLGDQCAIDRVHKHIDGSNAFDADLWRTITDLGWPMLAISPVQGGMADGLAALALVQEVIGARCAPIPFIGTSLLGSSLAAWFDSALAHDIANQINSGQVTGGVGDLFSSPRIRAARTPKGFVLSGDATLLDADGSDWVVAPVQDTEGGRGLALIQTSNIELDKKPVADRTRSIASVKLTAHTVAYEQVMLGKGAESTLQQLRTTFMLLLAADAIGGAASLLDLTVDYLKTRHQFGKPIGAFQALKHRIADKRTQLELAEALLAHARDCESDDPQALKLASMAKLSACEAYHDIAREAVQMHGGIGYTWEHQVHIYLKRATLDRALCGGPAKAQDTIAGLLMGRTS